MTFRKRIIAKIDFKNESLVKSMQFDGQRVLGKVEEFAEIYSNEGIDEILLVDSVASLYQRGILFNIIKTVAEKINVPLVYAGGVRSVQDVYNVLRCGADKVAINTAALSFPSLLKEASSEFGSQCISSLMEVFTRPDKRYELWTDFGREMTRQNFNDWVDKVVELGVGEIILSSINHDGMGTGFNLDLASTVAERVKIPVIISCGAGTYDHVQKALKTQVSGVAISSMLHYQYANPTNKFTNIYNLPKLREGQSVEAGNIDYLNEGYGGFREFLVTPTSVKALKENIF